MHLALIEGQCVGYALTVLHPGSDDTFRLGAGYAAAARPPWPQASRSSAHRRGNPSSMIKLIAERAATTGRVPRAGQADCLVVLAETAASRRRRQHHELGSGILVAQLLAHIETLDHRSRCRTKGSDRCSPRTSRDAIGQTSGSSRETPQGFDVTGRVSWKPSRRMACDAAGRVKV